MKELRYLDLDKNAVTQIEGYKDKVWALFPQLIVLDGFDKEGNEVESDDEEDEEFDDEEGEEEIENFRDVSKWTEEQKREAREQGLLDS